MGRLPKRYTKKDGSINLRIDVPPILIDLAKSLGELHKNTREPVEHGMWLLLRRLGYLFEQGKTDWIGDMDIERLLADLKIAKTEQILGRIPIEKLHQTPKLKSGFVGVFANGTNFRAQARMSFGSFITKWIGAFKTAEEAAWRRREYYLAHKLPYGEYELEADALLKVVMPTLRGAGHNRMRREVLTQLELTGRTQDYIHDGFSILPPEIEGDDEERVEFKAPPSTAPLRPGAALVHASIAVAETKFASMRERAAEAAAVVPSTFGDDFVSANKCSKCQRPYEACKCPHNVGASPYHPGALTANLPTLPAELLDDDYVPGTMCTVCKKPNEECRCR